MGINIFQQVGNNIQTVLKEKSLTQQHLANKLNISKQVMSKIVTGLSQLMFLKFLRLLLLWKCRWNG